MAKVKITMLSNKDLEKQRLNDKLKHERLKLDTLELIKDTKMTKVLKSKILKRYEDVKNYEYELLDLYDDLINMQ